LCFRQTTGGASAPIDHLCLVDLVPRVVGRDQARGVADRAVDVDHLTAGTTDQMMMVVADPILITSG
jgi:transcriptional regulator GlxA family with amidase domain